MKGHYYIKCSNCGELVELKSEYMVLCSKCNHKLDNSFSVWKSKNPQGGFDKYLDEVCVNELAITGVNQQRRITKKIKRGNIVKRLTIAGIVAVVLFLLIGSGLWLMRDYKSSSIDEILRSGWRLNYYDDLKSSVQFPEVLALVVDTTFVEIDTSTMVEKLVARQWVKPQVCNITAMRMEYQDDAGIDREKATSQILQSLIADNQMQAFQYIPSDYNLGQSKARMMTGSYLTGTQLNEFRAVMVIKREELWYFMVAYPAENPEGTILADKFFKTIQLQGE